ncbi:MAG: GtrA family protein [Bacilli bacterium]|nr:GtrA family protein [Bacilli bacterium]
MLELYKKYKEIINYLIFGFLTTVVSLVAYYLVTITILDPNVSLELQIANVISWIVGVLFAYFTNRAFVFNSKNENKLKEFITFTGARVSTLLLDMAVMFIFVTLLKGNDKVFKIVSQILVIVGNYLLSKLIVFKKDKNEK